MSRLWRRLRACLRREQFDRDLDDELRFHFESKLDENLEAGLAPDEARRRALRRVGNRALIRERSREVWGFRLLEQLIQDLGYGLRMMRRSPGFTLAAVLSIAVGIGANTTVFSLINAALLRPLPVPEPDRLVRVFSGRTGGNRYGRTSYQNYADLRDQSRTLALAAFSWAIPANLTMGPAGAADRAWGAVVSSNYFDVLGVAAALGRTFLPEEERDSAPRVVVLGHRLWVRSFAADPTVLGRKIRLNGRSFTVAGIMPPDCPQPELLFDFEFWVPMGAQADAMPGQAFKVKRRVETWLSVIGRLVPGAGDEAARAELALLTRHLAEAHPAENRTLALMVTRELVGRARPLGGLDRIGWILLAFTTIVLLIACCNVANLLMSRSLARRTEIVIRLSIGAGRGRIVRQLLTESLLLASAGAAAGVAAASWGAALLLRFKPPLGIETSLDPRADWRVFLFASAAAALAALAVGLAPALTCTRVDLAGMVKRGSSPNGGSSRWLTPQGVLVVFQVALSLVLLVAAGLFARSLEAAAAIDLGFQTERRLVATVDLGLAGYDDGQARDFQRLLLGRVAALPEVLAVSSTAVPPLAAGYLGDGRVFIDGEAAVSDDQRPIVYYDQVTPGFFATLGTPLLRGRDFTERDDEAAPRVAIVNETFARSFWGADDVVGRRFRLNRHDSTRIEVVGVVRNAKYHSLGEDSQRHVYLAARQSYQRAMTLVVHTRGDSRQAIPAIRDEVRALDSGVALTGAKTMAEHLGFAFYGPRMGAALFAIFGVIGLLLALLGLYGVLQFNVKRRTREIAIRIALGAPARAVLGLVVSRGLALTGIGVVIGLVSAAGVTRIVSGMLYGVDPLDAWTFIGASLLLGGVAVLASYLPARRAARVDPMEALRYE